MAVSVESLLMISTASSLVLGILFVVVGASIRLDSVQFINNYGSRLSEEIPPDACTDKKSGLDFCDWSSDLSSVFFGDWLVSLGSLLVVTGFFIVMLSCVGFVAACRKFKALLFLMIIIICGSVGLEAYLIDILTNQDSEFHITAKDQLLELLRDDYELVPTQKNSFTQALNVIMLQGECCGINGRDDFGPNITYTKGSSVYNFHNPPACCKREALSALKLEAFAPNTGCLEQPPSTKTGSDINTKGCYTTLFNYITSAYGAAVNGILLFLIISHTLDVVLAVTIIMRPAPMPRLSRYTIREDRGFPSIGSQNFKESKKFLPFAKTSSIAFDTTNRSLIGSTEIW